MQGQTQSISFDGREIRLTTGRFAPQAGGSVLVECGDTAVLVTATRSGGREGIDFLPLICDYEERLYAAGRIPGSYMRRESRPPERATLTARLIDRPMRPLFPSWLRDDLQVVATCLSLDERVPADVLAVTGASIATLLAGIPFNGPMAAVRVGLLGDDFVLNPSYREIERGDLDLVVAGTPDGVVMVEAGANQLPEQDVIEAIDFGYEAICELIKAQEQLLKDLGITQVKPEKPDEDSTVPAYLEKQCTKAISAILSKFDQSKDERDTALETVKGEVSETISGLKEDHAVRQALASSPKLLGQQLQGADQEADASADSQGRQACGRTRPRRGASDQRHGRRAAAPGAWLRSVPARTHPGALHRNAGHPQRCPGDGRPPSQHRKAVPAPLQLPSLLRR